MHTFLSLIFIVSVSILSSCTHSFKLLHSKKRFERKIRKFTVQNNIIYIEGSYYKSPDTLFVEANKIKKMNNAIILPGVNTLNFAWLYYSKYDSLIAIDSAACRAHQFLRLNIDLNQKGEYLIKNYGCHYGRHIVLYIK